MSWQYEYETQTVDLLDICSAVLVVDETGGGLAGRDIAVGFLDGERWEPKTYGPLLVPLKTVLRYTDEDQIVNHSDGGPGHVFENLSTLKRLFGQPGLKTLTRSAPDYGDVRIRFELAGEPRLGEQRHVIYWTLRVPSGSWQTVAQQTASGSPPVVVTGGNRRIHDPEIVFSAASTFTYTNAAGTVFSIQVQSGPTFPVTVSQINGEWRALDNGAADASQFVVCSRPSVMVFDPNASLSLTATASTTVRWRNRWA